jgi:hypothetical protein
VVGEYKDFVKVDDLPQSWRCNVRSGLKNSLLA